MRMAGDVENAQGTNQANASMLHSRLLLNPFARVPDSPSLFDSIEIFPDSLISVKATLFLIRHFLANSIFSPATTSLDSGLRNL